MAANCMQGGATRQLGFHCSMLMGFVVLPVFSVTCILPSEEFVGLHFCSIHEVGHCSFGAEKQCLSTVPIFSIRPQSSTMKESFFSCLHTPLVECVWPKTLGFFHHVLLGTEETNIIICLLFEDRMTVIKVNTSNTHIHDYICAFVCHIQSNILHPNGILEAYIESCPSKCILLHWTRYCL